MVVVEIENAHALGLEIRHFVGHGRNAAHAVARPAAQAVPGGYHLAISRTDVDYTAFADLITQARSTTDPAQAAALANTALDLWIGDPWTPDGFDWVIKDLLEDRSHAERISRSRPSGAARQQTQLTGRLVLAAL